MIVKMKKVTLLCVRAHQEATLKLLQKLGLLHVEHLQEPAGSELDEARAKLADVQHAVDALEHYHAERLKEEAPAPTPQQDLDNQAVVDQTWRLINHRKDYEESLDFWQREASRVEPFGSFDPHQAAVLAQRGIQVVLCKAGPSQTVALPDDCDGVLTVHHQDANGTYFSVITRQSVELPFESVALPKESLADMRTKISELQASLRENASAFTQLTAHLSQAQEVLHLAEDAVRFLEVQNGMGTTQPLAYLRGYCPDRDLEPIRQAAAEHGWGLVIDEAESADKVPTKIENPRWVKPIRTVFSFIGVVPGYEEIDISAIFLVFFSLFFAMIVGDAGYGALFLAGTFWAHRKFRQAPASIFHLLYITSVATIAWGVLTGNYFGITSGAAWIETVRFTWLTEVPNVMQLCFLIGAIHLTIAHGWNVVRLGKSVQAIAQVAWIGVVWTMYFLACALVLNKAFPSIMMPVFAVALVLLVLFMTPIKQLKEEWFNHIMLPLNLVSNFVDVVSYVRLFAVGTATLAVAEAFNQMALDIGAGGVVAKLIAVLIILLGHTLNIILAAMGVLVHGIRLNTLEFAGHLGLQWTGIPFNPFRHKAQSAETPEETETALNTQSAR
jgi:V/A-type H+/Na+-transporting ATPase subunit I